VREEKEEKEEEGADLVLLALNRKGEKKGEGESYSWNQILKETERAAKRERGGGGEFSLNKQKRRGEEGEREKKKGVSMGLLHTTTNLAHQGKGDGKETAFLDVHVPYGQTLKRGGKEKKKKGRGGIRSVAPCP